MQIEPVGGKAGLGLAVSGILRAPCRPSIPRWPLSAVALLLALTPGPDNLFVL